MMTKYKKNPPRTRGKELQTKGAEDANDLKQKKN